jgi:hypothetical protein
MVEMLDPISDHSYRCSRIEITSKLRESDSKSTIAMNEGIWIKYFNFFQVENVFFDESNSIAPIIALVNRVRIYHDLSKSLSKQFHFRSILALLRLSLTKIVIYG